MKRIVVRICLLMFLTGSVAGILLSGCKPPVNVSSQTNDLKSTDTEPAGESLYQTAGKWDDQNGDTIRLSELKGKIPVVSMVFTRCPYACPRIVEDMKAIEKQLPADKKDKVVFVLITFDSDRDHTQELKEFTNKMKLDKRWLVLHGDEEDVKELSMLLDVKYKKQPNGDFSHSSSITLLDTKGAIAVNTEGLGIDPKAILEKISTL